jgi:hypothetical protein
MAQHELEFAKVCGKRVQFSKHLLSLARPFR